MKQFKFMLELSWFKWGHQQVEAELSLVFRELLGQRAQADLSRDV